MSLVFQYGTMGAGKSTLALQMDHNLKKQGKMGGVFTTMDRSGEALITSRFGAQSPATIIEENTSILTKENKSLDYLVIDEVQFLSVLQVEELAELVDYYDLEIICFGLLNDFKSSLFPASQRLLEIADKLVPLPLEIHCHCGGIGKINARIQNGRVVSDINAPAVVIGDSDDAADTYYEVLCRKCWKLKKHSG